MFVSRYSDGLRHGRPGFDSLTGQDFSLHTAQTGSGAHVASYPMGKGALFPGCKSGRGVKLTIHLSLVPK
jgi:hypothetical protein